MTWPTTGEKRASEGTKKFRDGKAVERKKKKKKEQSSSGRASLSAPLSVAGEKLVSLLASTGLDAAASRREEQQ